MPPASAAGNAPIQAPQSHAVARRPIVDFFLRTWLGNVLAVIGLLFTILGVAWTIYTGVLSLHYNALQTCATLYSIGKYSEYCNKVLDVGTTPAPMIISAARKSANERIQVKTTGPREPLLLPQPTPTSLTSYAWSQYHETAKSSTGPPLMTAMHWVQYGRIKTANPIATAYFNGFVYSNEFVCSNEFVVVLSAESSTGPFDRVSSITGIIILLTILYGWSSHRLRKRYPRKGS
ncbi:hypothetical protein LTR56_021322 [Elasticomyces elasticus]|nr:hypothetical protein LTR56_021322 [Elasticomyces elasticus]KAK3662186.1 hypothetical protein LTR22_006951 [Elasticomyces elasticus]KAK4916164.1 hypothetical protein LTR49_015805 [Elasticomyces elasticus]KAK5767950.1 hypothetical protein LTS12_001767 [Elasticomyces elasticus]